MTTFATPKQYNDHLIQNLTKIALKDYFKAYHAQFYPDHDISFMEYFIEIHSKQYEFCVPHNKLFEYGIMGTGSDSYTVKTRLEKLKLKNDLHFTLQKVLERNSNDIGANTKYIYMLKPKAFKKMLMRAGKNSKQDINVEIYADYYLLLEDVHIDFTEYEREYSKKIDSIKDAKIDKLLDNNNQLLEINQSQSNEIKQLLKYAKDTNEELHEVKSELVDIKAQLARILSAVISLAYMPHIYKRFYDKDRAGRTVRDGKQFSMASIGKTKSLVFVATFDPNENQLKIECVNRKLQEPTVQINTIISRAKRFNENIEEDELSQMVLMPQSYGISTLNEQEIRSICSNKEHIKTLVDEFGVANIRWNHKFKAIIMNGVESFELAQECFDKFIDITQASNIHSYDQSLTQSIDQSGEAISIEALDELKRLNIEFVVKSKHIIDTYYKQMYACNSKCITYVYRRTLPTTDLQQLKTKISNLVISGLNFE